MTLSNAVRVTAGLAWRACFGVLTAAVAWFLTALREARLKAPANPREFVAMWGPRLSEAGEVVGRAQQAGRKRLVSQQQAEKAYNGAVGWQQAGEPRPYASLKALTEKCGPWREVMGDTGATAKTLLHAVQRLHPRFGYTLLRPRPTLTQDNKDGRMAVATAGKELTPRQLQLTVFIDACTFFAGAPPGPRGYVDSAVDRSCPAARPVKHNGRSMKVNVYGAVNALLGPVLLAFVSGSDPGGAGFKGRFYKVCSRAHQHRRLAGCHVAHRLTQLGSPPSGARAVGLAPPWVQPQHTETGCLCGSRQRLITQLPREQAAIRAASPGVKLACVLLPLNFNQKVGWGEQHHVPPVPAGLHRAAVARAHARRASQRVRLSSEQPHTPLTA